MKTTANQTRKQSDAVMPTIRQNVLQRKCACGKPIVGGGECASCRAKREGAAILQRKEDSSAHMNAVPSIVHDVLGSPGQPLDAGTLAYMEPRFGYDFSNVRIHTDARAAESAHAVGASAYTVGNRVAFAEGAYSPGSAAGRRLLAHELAHVLQQGSGSHLQTRLEVGSADTSAEREAEQIAHMVTGSYPATGVSVSAAVPGLTIQRECEDKNYRTCGGNCNGRRGTCTWYGITNGCRCRDRSEGSTSPVRFEVPSWLAALVGAAVVAAIVACFASGVCEFGAVVAGLGAGAAAAVIALLRAAGVVDSGATTASAADSGTGTEATA